MVTKYNTLTISDALTRIHSGGIVQYKLDGIWYKVALNFDNEISCFGQADATTINISTLPISLSKAFKLKWREEVAENRKNGCNIPFESVIKLLKEGVYMQYRTLSNQNEWTTVHLLPSSCSTAGVETLRITPPNVLAEECSILLSDAMLHMLWRVKT